MQDEDGRLIAGCISFAVLLSAIGTMMVEPMSTVIVSWALAGAGGLCAVLAAYLQGGNVAALGAASTAFLGAAGVLGWTGRAAVK